MEGWLNNSRWSSTRWRLDEQEPVEAGGGRGSPWRLEEVHGGDEQYPVESRFAVRHTPPDEQDPVLTVALQHKSVSSVLRYATPLPINRTPASTVGGRFVRFAVRHTPPDQ